MPSDKSDDSGSEHHDQLPASLNMNVVAAKDAASLRRGREGSLEPYPEQPISQAPNTTTKKNRLAPTSSTIPTTGQPPSKPLDPETSPNIDMSDSMHSTDSLQPGEVLDKPEGRVGIDQPGREAGNIGEVRRKVAEMTHGEREQGKLDEDKGEEAQASEKENAQSVIPADEVKWNGDGRDVGIETGEDWEKVEKSELSEAGDHNGEPDGLKRKALDRSESSVFTDGDSTKRLKDFLSPPLDSAVDDTAAPAHASAESPKSAAPKKPQATFSSFSSSVSPFASKGSASPFASSSTSAPKPFSSSGFGAFSSTSSPFAKKPTSPLPTPVDGASSSIIEKEEKGEETSRGGPSSFGDILQQENAADEEDSKVQMTTKDVTTGEESEETLYSGRAKLFSMEPDGGWRERGVGALKLNVRKSDGKGARLVMRAEGVLRLILNASLYVGMPCLEDGKHVRTTVFEEGERKFITFRTGSAKAAAELANAIHDYTPLESASVSSSKSPEGLRGDTEGAV